MGKSIGYWVFFRISQEFEFICFFVSIELIQVLDNIGVCNCIKSYFNECYFFL